MSNLSDKLKEIVEKFETEDDSYYFFEKFSGKKELGIVSIDKRAKKFDLRGEKTPSVKAYKHLTYVDYGGEGIKKNIIHLIRENTKCSFPQAVNLLISWLEEDDSVIPEAKGKIEYSNEKVAPYSDFFIKKQIKERANPENKESFTRIVKGLFRGCSIEEMRVGVKAFDIGFQSYTVNNDGIEEIEERIFIPEYDENQIPWGSYRYNRDLARKGLLRKNCKRVLFGSHLLEFYDKKKPLIVDEGHSDVCVNVAKYLQAVTTGSSTTSIKPFLDLLKGFTLHFYPDADHPGIKGVTQKIIDIELFNQTQTEEDKIKYEVFFWGVGYIDDRIKDFKSLCVPLSEIQTVEKSSKDWWIPYFTDETLTENISLEVLALEQQKIIDTKLKEVKVELGEKIYIKNWKKVSKEFVKQGFDFIDFHIKYNGTENYGKFLAKYKFK